MSGVSWVEATSLGSKTMIRLLSSLLLRLKGTELKTPKGAAEREDYGVINQKINLVKKLALIQIEIVEEKSVIGKIS